MDTVCRNSTKVDLHSSARYAGRFRIHEAARECRAFSRSSGPGSLARFLSWLTLTVLLWRSHRRIQQLIWENKRRFDGTKKGRRFVSASSHSHRALAHAVCCGFRTELRDRVKTR